MSRATHYLRGTLLCVCVLLPLSAHAQQNSLVRRGEYVIQRASSQPAGGPPNLAISAEAHDLELVQTLAGSSDPEQQAPAAVEYQPSENLCDSIMADDSTIIRCSPNFIKKLYAIPNDTGFDALWGLQNPDSLDIDAERAWDLHSGSGDVIVAVLDTGVDYTHPDLSSNIWLNTQEIPGNGIDDDANGYVDDIRGISTHSFNQDPFDLHSHGTHVAGTIAARGNNGVGVVGVNWKAKILPVRCIGGSLGSLFDLVKAFNYVIALKNRGENIVAINASYGGAEYLEIEKVLIERARDAGILVIAAAGNSNNNNDFAPSYPANYTIDNLVSVAAINPLGRLASFSNFGENSVHIAAPGQDIYSTLPGGDYGWFDGTSMATPHVTGAVALLKSYRPQLGYHQLRDTLLTTGTPVSDLYGFVSTASVLNLYELLEKAPSLGTAPPDTVTPQGDAGEVSLHLFRNRTRSRSFVWVYSHDNFTAVPYQEVELLWRPKKKRGRFRVVAAGLTQAQALLKFRARKRGFYSVSLSDNRRIQSNTVWVRNRFKRRRRRQS